MLKSSVNILYTYINIIYKLMVMASKIRAVFSFLLECPYGEFGVLVYILLLSISSDFDCENLIFVSSLMF